MGLCSYEDSLSKKMQECQMDLGLRNWYNGRVQGRYWHSEFLVYFSQHSGLSLAILDLLLDGDYEMGLVCSSARMFARPFITQDLKGTVYYLFGF